MNKNKFEAQVWASNMNQTAKLVAVAVASHGNWEDGTEVRPSAVRLAGMCSVSRDTASKYVEALEYQGWLRHVKTLKNNVKEYELCEQAAEPIGILAKQQRKVSEKQRQNLRGVVADSIGNLDGPVEVESHDETGLGCRELDSRLQKVSAQVAEPVCTTLSNLTSLTLEQEQTVDVSVADAPAPSTLTSKEEEQLEETPPLPSNFKRTPDSEETTMNSTTLPKFNRLECLSYFAKNIQYHTHLNLKEQNRVRELVVAETFRPDLVMPSLRMHEAMLEVSPIEEEVKVEW